MSTGKVRRLFTQFAPDQYKIQIELAEDKKSFNGSITILGTKKGRPSERMTFHQKALTITNPTITHIDKKGQRHAVPVARTVTQKSYDEVRLHTENPMNPGAYEVSMDFSGPITKNMDGVYPCFFSDGDTEKQLIATQFESHHAREAFPCVDEPEAKATFQLVLTHAENEIALSNTMPTGESSGAGKKTTTFGTTPVMSTYLLAFVVGELEMKEKKSKSGVTIRTFATKEQIEHTTFALEEASEYMDFYEQYYDIPFPLEKCDFVALPDFASGAMENWGLITFREQTLLVDPTTSLSTKQYVAIVVAHELTHQWFGNLVTMRWWTDLWLNEGFASWMEYLAVNDRHPEWQLWTQFAVDDQQAAMKADALEHTHPIEVEVRHPDEIRGIFDMISYQKGASMIHMLHDYLGADSFRDGLRHYLKKHSYKNTDTVDLWQALEDITKKPVKEFMHSWTAQSGFPILTVNTENDHLVIAQTKFVANPSSSARKDTTLWPIPLLANGLEKGVVNKKKTNVQIKKGSAAPTKINVGQTGFYRVDYSHEQQNEQIKLIESGAMQDIDRMGLLSDGLETTKAGYQPVTELLDLLEHFRSESTLPVWEIIASAIGSVRGVLSTADDDTKLRDAMKPFVRELVSEQLVRLGLEEKKDESHLDTLLRPIIVGLAAQADEETVIVDLLAKYRKKIDSGVAVDPNIRGIIYGTAARLGGQKEYDELLKLHETTLSSDEKLSIAAAMTSFEQPEIHEKVLKMLLDEKIKFQDVPYWIAYSMMNRHSRDYTWKWMQENWKWMQKNMGTDLSFARFPLYVARTFSDAKRQKEFETFFTDVMEPIIKRSYSQGLEIIQTAAAWRSRDSKAALDWFTSENKK